MSKKWSFPEYPENWNEISREAKRRDGYRCTECGSSNGTLHAHHIVSLSKGGSNDLSNLTTLCEECHAKYHPHLRPKGLGGQVREYSKSRSQPSCLSTLIMLVLAVIVTAGWPAALVLVVIAAAALYFLMPIIILACIILALIFVAANWTHIQTYLDKMFSWTADYLDIHFPGLLHEMESLTRNEKIFLGMLTACTIVIYTAVAGLLIIRVIRPY